MRAAYSEISQLSEHKRRDERDNQRCAKQKEGVTLVHAIQSWAWEWKTFKDEEQPGS